MRDGERDKCTENSQWNQYMENKNEEELTKYGIHDHCRENMLEGYMQQRSQDGGHIETRKKDEDSVNNMLKKYREDGMKDKTLEFGTQVRHLENGTEDQYAEEGPQERYIGEEDTEGESYRQHIIHEWFSHDNVP